ncbi:hypothetical protein QBC34DRAFT_425682 [Podospora aff. communis PSN243]|uniref:Uncharacterized protein n=1 Tax=Podospora aff. communis PSN243 TaxID=3040156 RepID=A0AAV9GM43_9PEZI|nr:hypothetical protein QBC34DRAFT_425682 [Podospora aff. communis PSN243]
MARIPYLDALLRMRSPSSRRQSLTMKISLDAVTVIASVLGILPFAASLAPPIPASTIATEVYIANTAAITSLPSSGIIHARNLGFQARDNTPWGYISGNSASPLSCETGYTFKLETYTSNGKNNHYFWGQEPDETDTVSACSRLGLTSCMYCSNTNSPWCEYFGFFTDTDTKTEYALWETCGTSWTPYAVYPGDFLAPATTTKSTGTQAPGTAESTGSNMPPPSNDSTSTSSSGLSVGDKAAIAGSIIGAFAIGVSGVP